MLAKPEKDSILTTTTTELATEEQLEELYQDLCEQLYRYFDHLSVDSSMAHMVNAAMFTIWCERMALDGDREIFDSLLQDTLNEPWEEVTFH
jgi:hypothetical protein